MEPLYTPHEVEARWQRVWEEEGLYAAEPDPSRKSFVIAHPPPNVTGELHMGHALQLALADSIVRLRRMQGYNVLFQTGYDHAGISTQSVVEKELEREGTSREELGREAFEERVWEWLRLYGRTIMSQFRRMGASMDYRRERFTMDDGYIRAVMHFFIHLYGKGWIYRANRMINWCPYHGSALSDLELVHEEIDDVLVYLRYPLVEGDGHVTVATVRPVTILADVAVAVHPDDERYRNLVGKSVVVPFVERHVPVIADDRVDREFGTGALKVTPGHDPMDFEIGRDHGLPEPRVIGPDGRMNDEAGELTGLTQEDAGERVLAWLRERGQLEREEPYSHSVAFCERCGSRIEPLISLQWWCSMAELKQPALEALRERRVRFHPESQHRFAIDSLENAPDWCISRQLWWGHRIPVWYCDCGAEIIAEAPDYCEDCGDPELHQEEDVLDTWFSSALWPFATLGWPDETPELRAFYPGDLNTTAREIIRLWENRMIFSGLELMGDVPFHDVVIHTTVLARDGRRMSKSLGTGIDPLEIIDAHGADATRYGLLKMSSAQDVRFSDGAVEEGRKLANKLWNVGRLVLSQADGIGADPRPRSVEERWILSRLDETRELLEQTIPSFAFADAVHALYHLTFDDFCDWYAEAIKPRLHEGDEDARATALAALEQLLALLHPVMPHVTEEIWSQFHDSRLIVAPWPEPTVRDDEAAAVLERIREAAAIFRRSGARIELEGDALRIFEAVVRPRRAGGNGKVEAECERLRNEILRCQRMLSNEGFVSKAPPEVVEAEREKLARYRREADALGC